MPFVSQYCLNLNITFNFAVSCLDLPVNVKALDKYPHEIAADGNRGVNIKAGSDAIFFKEELLEGRCKLRKDLIINHTYK